MSLVFSRKRTELRGSRWGIWSLKRTLVLFCGVSSFIVWPAAMSRLNCKLSRIVASSWFLVATHRTLNLASVLCPQVFTRTPEKCKSFKNLQLPAQLGGQLAKVLYSMVGLWITQNLNCLFWTRWWDRPKKILCVLPQSNLNRHRSNELLSGDHWH